MYTNTNNMYTNLYTHKQFNICQVRSRCIIKGQYQNRSNYWSAVITHRKFPTFSTDSIRQEQNKTA